jgi:transposase InsO family protein
MDYLGPLVKSHDGFSYILVIICGFSRYMELIACKAADAATTEAALESRLFCRWGNPDVLASDAGKHFDNHRIADLLARKGILQHIGTPYNSQGRGIVERQNRSIMELIRILCGTDKTRWSDHVGRIQFWCNTAINNTTGLAPHQVLMGVLPKTDVRESMPKAGTAVDPTQLKEIINGLQDIAIRNTVEAHRSTQINHTTSKMVPVFNRNELVMVFDHGKEDKLDPRWKLGYRIVGQINSNVYEVVDPVYDTKRQVHVKDLQHYNATRHGIEAISEALLPPGYLMAKEVLGHRVQGDEYEFEISWKGYGAEQNQTSWEPYTNVRKLSIVQDYKARIELEQPSLDPSKAAGKRGGSGSVGHRVETVDRPP